MFGWSGTVREGWVPPMHLRAAPRRLVDSGSHRVGRRPRCILPRSGTTAQGAQPRPMHGDREARSSSFPPSQSGQLKTRSRTRSWRVGKTEAPTEWWAHLVSVHAGGHPRSVLGPSSSRSDSLLRVASQIHDIDVPSARGCLLVGPKWATATDVLPERPLGSLPGLRNLFVDALVLHPLKNRDLRWRVRSA
jgi:hypothetical protein